MASNFAKFRIFFYLRPPLDCFSKMQQERDFGG